MAQRIRSCTNTTNMDTINCDSYQSRLIKPNRTTAVRGGKSNCVQRCPRDRSASNTRSSYAVALPATPPNLKTRSGTLRQHNLPSPARTTNVVDNNNLVHKEVIADNSAMVEVTVRAHTSRRPRTGDSRTVTGTNKSSNREQPWGALLKPTKSTDQLSSSSFGSFDPLRTVHFLAKELQTKLQASSPNDPNVIQMIADMQHALSRVPPEVVATVRLQQELEKVASKKLDREPSKQHKNGVKFVTDDDLQFPEKLARTIKPPTTNKSCQTLNVNTDGTVTESEMFQKLLEASTLKLESSCRQMEQVCNRLKNEKDQLELLLSTEKDTVKFLRKQIEDAEFEKTRHSKFAFEEVLQERNALQAHVTKLQVQLDSIQGPSVQELRSLVQKLQAQKKDTEQEVLHLRHNLTLCTMEKDKYAAILSIRDRQVNEIRTEMNQLQEVVNEQLMELQKTPPYTSSLVSSQTTVLASTIWSSQGQGSDGRSRESGDNPGTVTLFGGELRSEESSVSNLGKTRRKGTHDLSVKPPPVQR